jgi:hypothetical protein
MKRMWFEYIHTSPCKTLRRFGSAIQVHTASHMPRLDELCCGKEDKESQDDAAVDCAATVK